MGIGEWKDKQEDRGSESESESESEESVDRTKVKGKRKKHKHKVSSRIKPFAKNLVGVLILDLMLLGSIVYVVLIQTIL